MTRKDFIYHYKQRIFESCLNWAVLGTAIVGFHYSSFMSSHPAGHICNWLRNNPLWSDHYKHRHSQVFCHNKNVHSEEAGPAWLILANFLFLYGNLWKLKGFSGSLSDQFEQPGALSTKAFSHTHNKKKRRQEKALRQSKTTWCHA